MFMNERMPTMNEREIEETCGLCGHEYGEHCDQCGACVGSPHDESCGW
jgi:methionyl-tRNA synthetase